MDNKKLNVNEEDTMYFGDDDISSFESNNNIYSEEDMYENYKPLTNTNSVEYDDGDYASPFYGVDREENRNNRKRIIISYVVVIFIILVFIVVAIIGMK